MKSNFSSIRSIAALLAMSAGLLTGCQSEDTTMPPPDTTPVIGQPAQPRATTTASYGPSHSRVQRDGQSYIKGSLAYPTGLLESSSVLLEKYVPEEVMAGQPYTYYLEVTNLTDYPMADVVVRELVGGNFTRQDSTPPADNVTGDISTWLLGTLGPRQTKEITIRASSPEEGFVELCGSVTFVPLLCERINVVRADLQIVKEGPSEVLICDPITYTFRVENTGSSNLSNVVVTDQLPDGLTTAGGQRAINLNVGDLAPGQGRDVTAQVTATRTGVFNNTATATSAQNVTAEDSHTITVRQPVLEIACTAPGERFVGRPINVCFTVSNSGDAAARNTRIVLPLQSGLNFQGATQGGRIEGNSVVWDLGEIAPNGSEEVCVTFTASAPGEYSFNASVSGYCAPAASTVCATVVSGIPAILLEVIDLEDPIEVGRNVTYQVTVTNQGSAPGTNVRIVAELEDAQNFVSAAGATQGRAEGNRIVFEPVPVVPPQAHVQWRITVAAEEAGDVRFKIIMDSDQVNRSVQETESTHQYE